MGIIVFAGKNVSTRAKYFSTTRKKDFYRQTHVFPLMGITYPVLAKTVLLGKICEVLPFSPTEVSMLPLARKYFHYRRNYYHKESMNLYSWEDQFPLLQSLSISCSRNISNSIAATIIVFTSWKICFQHWKNGFYRH